MRARALLAFAILLGSLSEGQTQVPRRGLQGVSTGMTLQDAWGAATRAGGRCSPDSGRSSASPAFSCMVDGLSLIVGRTNYTDPPRVTRLTVSFVPRTVGKDLPTFLRDELGVVHDVTPDGRELPSWRPLAGGETVKASCDAGPLPGNVPSPGRCQVEVADTQLMAADRAMGAQRHWVPVPFRLQ